MNEWPPGAQDDEGTFASAFEAQIDHVQTRSSARAQTITELESAFPSLAAAAEKKCRSLSFIGLKLHSRRRICRQSLHGWLEARQGQEGWPTAASVEDIVSDVPGHGWRPWVLGAVSLLVVIMLAATAIVVKLRYDGSRRKVGFWGRQWGLRDTVDIGLLMPWLYGAGAVTVAVLAFWFIAMRYSRTDLARKVRLDLHGIVFGRAGQPDSIATRMIAADTAQSARQDDQ